MSKTDSRKPCLLDRLVLLLLIALGAVLLAALLFRVWTEHGGTNSYALVAQSFLNGTPYVEGCFDEDCVSKDGRTYVVFPPLPGLVALPLVAILGPKAKGFVAIGLMAWGLSLFFWLRIFAKIGLDRTSRLWVLAAIGFASPLFYVTLRGDGIWFFAQAIAFPLVTLAIHEATEDRLVTSGVALAGALLCRQMSIFYAPLLFLMTVRSNERLIAIDRERIGRAIKLALPILTSLLAYLACNAWRFGSPFESGYSFILGYKDWTQPRIAAHGVWSLAYVPFNTVYLLLQGFHAEFAEPELLKIIGMDLAGGLSCCPRFVHI